MSRLFQEDGTSIPVTIVSVAGNFVTDIKTSDRDGYSSVVLSKQFFKKKKLKKSQAEYFKKHNVNPGKLHEFRTSDVDDLKVGLHVDASVFEAGQKVDVTGTSKGKGYAGVIKRHNFRMQDATHGNSLSHRAHGSTRSMSNNLGGFGRVRKCLGQMGNVQKTVQNLEVVQTDIENNLIYIKGAVPGPTGSTLKLSHSVKTS